MFKLPLQQEERQILHIDADAFFASVEQILNPKLQGKPVLVGGPTSKRGIVSAASYEARKFGIKSGMPMYLAKRKCPKAKVVSGNFKIYRDFSKRMYEIFTKNTPDVEMSSIDEAYLDITGCHGTFNESPENYTRALLMEIYGKLGLSVSCGLASSKMVAKVASSQNKPHKFTMVPFGSEAKFLAPLSLRAMPGIGPRTSSMLSSYGFDKIEDVAKLSLGEVMDKFGTRGIAIWRRCRGFDNSPVISATSLPKSISKEHTFYNQAHSGSLCVDQLKLLSMNVFAKLRRYHMKAAAVFVKIRYKREVDGKYKFEDYTFQRNLTLPSCIDSKLFPVVRELFFENYPGDEPVRLVGMGVTKLVQNYNLTLFGRDDDKEDLFMRIDAMKQIYGDKALTYGA
jgi:DNA polymerase IV